MSLVNAIAVTALQAASVRLAVAAGNLANARVSAPLSDDGEVLGSLYAPKAVVGVTMETGGVRAELVPVAPAFVIGTDPAHPSGSAAFPNVDVAMELVNMRIAANSYKAAATLIATSQELDDALLDI